MLSTTVEQELKKWEGSYPKGWRTIVEKCIKLCAEHKSLIEVHQVKEKFGGLRFYYEFLETEPEKNTVDHMLYFTPFQDKILALEFACLNICEECGTSLEVTNGPLDPKVSGWLRTLCPNCRTYLLAVKDTTK
jgi:hypothetical protein